MEDDMLELDTYFIWGQKAFSDWWISGNKRNGREYAWLDEGIFLIHFLKTA